MQEVKVGVVAQDHNDDGETNDPSYLTQDMS